MGDDKAPAPKRKRCGQRRAKFAPLDMSPEELNQTLQSEEGIALYRADVLLRVRRGGTALELEAISREMRIIDRAEAALLRRQAGSEVEELAAGLAEMNKKLAGKGGGALRADMAIAPPEARSTGTLQ